MPGRLCRDEIIIAALNMAMLPNLEVRDAPDGVVMPDAFSIQWLQDILDFWYHMVPFSATVVKVPLNCVAHTDTITLPDDFILDVRNGYLVETIPGDSQSLKRITRVPLQKFINRSVAFQKSSNVKYPHWYCVVGEAANGSQTMKLSPVPDIATRGYLWYYQLPAALTATQKPSMPNDYVCKEYIRIRALEWANIAQPGTAQQFCDKIVATMKAAGLMNEPEDDELPFDTSVTHGPGGIHAGHPYSWMGSI